MNDSGTASTEDRLREIPHLVSIAWHAARAHPETEDEALADLLADLRRRTNLVIMNLRQAREAASRKSNAMERAHRAAETKIENALADAHASAAVEGVDPDGFYVYCLWGSDPARPIYVGRSTNIFARLGSHMSDPRKRYDVKRITLTKCSTWHKMCRTEERLIAHYQPPLNSVGIRPVEVAS